MINAKLSKILVSLVLIWSVNQYLFAQETDPISEAVFQEQQKQQQEGMNISMREQKQYERMMKKYELSEKEKDVRIKREKGEKLRLSDKYRIGKANRKDYLRKKKTDEFNKKLILNRQNEATRKRMVENDKRIKKRDKEIKRKQKRKKFFNLFR
jgi:Flp pilus assembly protein TadD